MVKQRKSNFFFDGGFLAEIEGAVAKERIKFKYLLSLFINWLTDVAFILFIVISEKTSIPFWIKAIIVVFLAISFFWNIVSITILFLLGK